MGVSCPVFSNYDQMLRQTKPDYVIVTTVDSTHDEFIVKALEMGIDVITEKPMTTDEKKMQKDSSMLAISGCLLPNFRIHLGIIGMLQT